MGTEPLGRATPMSPPWALSPSAEPLPSPHHLTRAPEPLGRATPCPSHSTWGIEPFRATPCPHQGHGALQQSHPPSPSPHQGTEPLGRAIPRPHHLTRATEPLGRATPMSSSPHQGH